MALPAMPPLCLTPDCEHDLSQPAPVGATRFLSYPLPEQFSPNIGYRDFLQAVASLRTRGSRHALALMLHLPSGMSRQASMSVGGPATDMQLTLLLTYLKRECEMQGKLLVGVNQIARLTLRGLAVARLSLDQLNNLMQHARRWFAFAPSADMDCEIEVAPPLPTISHLFALREAGFTRIDLGAAQRPETVAECSLPLSPRTVVAAARAAQFLSVSITVEFGLPGQTVMSLARTLDAVIACRIERVVLRMCLPDIGRSTMPSKPESSPQPQPSAIRQMQSLSIRRLLRAGYVYLGMHTFVRADDPLAVAQAQGHLHCSLDGFSAHSDYDVVGCGLGAVSAIGAFYAQNLISREAYFDRLDDASLPLASGIELSIDGALRRAVMQMLLCHRVVQVTALEQAWPISFAEYFHDELLALQPLVRDGLLNIDTERLSVTLRGHFFLDAIRGVFDPARRLRADAARCVLPA